MNTYLPLANLETFKPFIIEGAFKDHEVKSYFYNDKGEYEFYNADNQLIFTFTSDKHVGSDVREWNALVEIFGK